jgi:hypothetical protein
MNEFDNRPRAALWRPVLTATLWAVTSVLSVVMIPYVLDVVTRIYVAFWGAGVPGGESYWTIVPIRQLLVVPLGVFAVVIIIGGAEYHTRAVNTERSWRLLAVTLALEAALVLSAVIV